MKTTIEFNAKTEAVDSIIEALADLSTSELVEVHNHYCREISSEDEIYANDEEFFEMMGWDGHTALQRAHFGEYRWNDEYLKLNGYGNLESTDYPEDSWIDKSEIAAYIDENREAFEDYFDFEKSEEETEN